LAQSKKRGPVLRDRAARHGGVRGHRHGAARPPRGPW